MKFPINQFEQHIDGTILKRGLGYFKQGLVAEPEELRAGVYEAVVSGTEDYRVRITIKDGMVTDHVCSCPYDLGPVCKHVVALLCWLQKDQLGIRETGATKRSSRGTAKPKPAKPSIADRVNEILGRTPVEQLHQFIREQADQEPSFRNAFLAALGHTTGGDSKAQYKQQLKALLRSAKGRDRFIAWNKTVIVGKGVYPMLRAAEKQLEQQDYMPVFHACTAVMEELVPALQYSDDSNGDLGGGITIAYDLLEKLAREPLPADLRKTLLDYCLGIFTKGTFEGWDWHLGMLQVAALIVDEEKDADRIGQLIEKTKLSEYEQQHVQLIRLELIRRIQGDQAAEKFLEKHLAHDNLRRKAIELAFGRRDYAKALRFAEDGVRRDSKGDADVATQWHDWLLRIAQAQADREQIIKHARLLFLHDYRHEQDYYQVLKDTVPAGKWKSFVQALIRTVVSGNRWTDYGLAEKIFIREEMWDKLLELLSIDPDLNRIERYESYLAKYFAPDLVRLYAATIPEYIRLNSGRNHYQIAVRYMRRMKKLGGSEAVHALIVRLNQEFSKRKSLLEELERV